MRPTRPSDSGNCLSRARSFPAALRCTVEVLERRALLSTVIPAGPEFRSNTYTSSDQMSPSIAMDADGDFVVAWQSFYQDGSSYGVYAQRFNAAGVPQGDEFRANTYTTGIQWQPSVAMDAEGDFVIAWSGAGEGTSGIFARRYDPDGVPQGAELRVNTHTGGRAPVVAMDAAGDFVVAWQGYLPPSGGVLARRYSAAGEPQSAVFRVNTQPFAYLSNISLATDADGDFVVAWDGIGLGIRAQRFNSDGVAQGGELRVNTYTTDTQFFPSVAMDAAGNFLVAWRSAGQASPLSIFAQRYRADGAAQGGEFRVNTFASFQDEPAAAMDRDGDSVIAWQSYPQDRSEYGIYAQRYSPAGAARGGEFRVNSHTPNSQMEAAVAMNADGDFVVAWQSDAQDGSGNGVFAQRYAVVPEVVSSSFLFESSPQRLRFRFNHDVRDSLAADDLVVRNLTTGQPVPSDQFALLYDPLSDVATFIYTGPGNGSIAGVLPDGRYRARLRAEGIVTPQGASPAADHEFEFFFLNGDANRDGEVNLRDFNVLARHFGQTGTDFTRGDFTFDGTTDLEDFGVLAARFGSGLPGAASASLGTRGAPSGAEHADERDLLAELLR